MEVVLFILQVTFFCWLLEGKGVRLQDTMGRMVGQVIVGVVALGKILSKAGAGGLGDSQVSAITKVPVPMEGLVRVGCDQGWVGGRAGTMNSGNSGGPAPGAVGGFGGGGGGSEDNGASGGGGGYSGGGSGTHPNQAGGGGGSYCSGCSCSGASGGNSNDDGMVQIVVMTKEEIILCYCGVFSVACDI